MDEDHSLNLEINSVSNSDELFNFKSVIKGRDSSKANFQKLSQFYLQNSGGYIRMAMVSEQGKARVCSRAMESFTLE